MSRPELNTPLSPEALYNRHLRDYFRANPGAALEDALRAWKERRGKRAE